MNTMFFNLISIPLYQNSSTDYHNNTTTTTTTKSNDTDPTITINDTDATKNVYAMIMKPTNKPKVTILITTLVLLVH